MDPPPPHSHSSSSTSFPILAISILGILATAILLLSYYLFVIKCCLNWRLRRSPFRSPSLRRHRPAVDPARDSRGLDNSAIRSIPTLRYTRSTNATTAKPIECAVCLAEFEERELLRLLPGCGHSFHIDCIDTWLQSSANCPLCRFDVSRVPIHNYRPLPVSQVAVEVTDISAAAAAPTPIGTATTPKASKPRRFWQAASMGDECIDISRGKDETFAVQPIRRSFSMDSSNDRALFLSVQDILQQSCRELARGDARRGEESSGDGGGGGGNACGRIRRSFFSFGRSSRTATAVLPLQSDFC